MALTTYAELQAKIASDLFGRTDKTAEIKDAIRLTEAHMSNNLKCREMDTTSTLTITSGEATVPTDLQSVKSLRLLSSPYSEIDYEPIELIETRRPDVTGTIEVYDIVGEKFVFWPPSSDSARLRYRADIPALSDSNTSNWILAGHPHMYVYGSLWQMFLHLKDEARANTYGSMFTASIEELNMRDRVSRLAMAQVGPSTQPV